MALNPTHTSSLGPHLHIPTAPAPSPKLSTSSAFVTVPSPPLPCGVSTLYPPRPTHPDGNKGIPKTLNHTLSPIPAKNEEGRAFTTQLALSCQGPITTDAPVPLFLFFGGGTDTEACA